MNRTQLRAGLALVGTAAVLTSGAITTGAAAQAYSAPAAGVSTSTSASTSAPASTAHKGGGHKGGGHGDEARKAKGRAAVTFMVECVDDNRVQQPKTFTLSCADDNQRLENLAWKRWGHRSASATGIVRENVSTPMSKGDKWISYPVKVTASQLVDGEASATYGKLTVRVVGKLPNGVPRVETFTLPGNEAIGDLAKPTKPAKKAAKPNVTPV